MEHKAIYRIMDSKGRVYVPAACREAAGIHTGDIVRLDVQQGKLTAHRVELIEVGDKSPDAVAAYIAAGIPQLTDTQLQTVMEQMLKRLQKNTGGDSK